jgi:hypothetical protein
LNLHVPKDTSPSSYDESLGNESDDKDLSITPPPSGDHGGDRLAEKGEVTALPVANRENPEMAVLVDLLTTLSSQERAQIISELSQEQRYTIAHLLVHRLTCAKAGEE